MDTVNGSSKLLSVSEDRMDVDTLSENAINVLDDGMKLLYPDIGKSFPFKTCDRILDDLRIAPWFINERNQLILGAPLLEYSRERQHILPFTILHLIDQVNLQTRYEYSSLTCPQKNTVTVMFALLVDPEFSPRSFDEITEFPKRFFHLKVTVKKRSHLESFNRHAGITHYHVLNREDLHPFDKEDIYLLEREDKRLISQNIFVSTDTNRLVAIEILRPEFTSEDLVELTPIGIKERYRKACAEFQGLDSEDFPNQAECLKTLFMVFKNPLQRKNASTELKVISKDSLALNSQINTNWLTEKFCFSLSKGKVEDNIESGEEYKPPDLVDYLTNFKVRDVRESYLRKSLEITLFGKHSMDLEKKSNVERKSMAKCFSNQHFDLSHTWWFNILNQQAMEGLPQDINYHFINLSVSFKYPDKDIIKNYETLISLDSENIGHYFDALRYVANSKASYQLISFCSRQDVVSYEDLNSALKVFGIDAKEVDANALDESTVVEFYNNNLSKVSEETRKDIRSAMRVLGKFKQSKKILFLVDHEPYFHVEQAYRFLKVDATVDSDLIETAYTIKISDSPGLKQDSDRALLTIALDRRSLSLVNFLFEQIQELSSIYDSSKMSYETAFRLLGIDLNANDDVILEVFQKLWNHGPISSPDQFLQLKTALENIAMSRNSKLISKFLTTGLVDFSCLPIASWPAGINNMGNTCYLNSLLQYYFTVKPLREFILEYNTPSFDFTGESMIYAKRRIGGRKVNSNEVTRSVQFVYHLRDLFNEMIYTNERCVTPSKELVYLAFAPSNIEVEFDDDKETIEIEERELVDFNDAASTDSSISEHRSNRSVDVIMDELSSTSGNIGNGQGHTFSHSTKIAKISAAQLENTLEIGRQQDVTECIGNVLSQLEIASEPLSLDTDLEQNDLVKQLFYGKLKQQLIPTSDATNVRTKYERFLSLLVNIGDHPRDIYDALDLYFKDDNLSLDEDGEVRRKVTVSEVPSILQIQIQRVYYDREKFMPFKSIEPLPFSDTLYMDRYMDTSNPKLLKEIKKSDELKMELRKLKARQRKLLSKNEMGLTFKSALIETRRFLQSDVLAQHSISVENPEFSLEQIDWLLQSVDEELKHIYTRILELETSINGLFQDFTQFGYSLFAVFIHRGEASYGHYWVHIKDHTKDDTWRKYNDDAVTEVPLSEVFNFAEGNTATPYFLVYVRQGEETETINPLKRIIDGQ